MYLRVVASLLAFLVLWPSLAVADECEEFKAREVEVVDNFSRDFRGGAFFISVFGKNVPVPNRYVVNARSSHYIELFSGQVSECFSLGLGRMAVGSLEGYRRNFSDSEIMSEQNSKLEVIGKYKIYRLRKKIGGQLSVAIIHDGNQFFSIMDGNDGLVAAMITFITVGRQ